MPAHAILIDLLAALAAIAGFLIAFRQRLVRRLWAALRGAAAVERPRRPDSEDPVHYALIIFGMMLLAFGLILFGFITVYTLTVSR